MNAKYEKEILEVVFAAEELTKLLSHESAHRLLVDVNSLNNAVPRKDALDAYEDLRNRVKALNRICDIKNLNIKR